MRNTFLHTRAQTLSLYALAFPVNTHTHKPDTLRRTLCCSSCSEPSRSTDEGENTHTHTLKHKADSASISTKNRVVTGLYDITIHISTRVCARFGLQKQEKDQKKCPTLLRVKISVGFVKRAKTNTEGNRRQKRSRGSSFEAQQTFTFWVDFPQRPFKHNEGFFLHACMCVRVCYEFKRKTARRWRKQEVQN